MNRANKKTTAAEQSGKNPAARKAVTYGK